MVLNIPCLAPSPAYRYLAKDALLATHTKQSSIGVALHDTQPWLRPTGVGRQCTLQAAHCTFLPLYYTEPYRRVPAAKHSLSVVLPCRLDVPSLNASAGGGQLGPLWPEPLVVLRPTTTTTCVCLCALQVSEQVDSLRVLFTDPVDYLVTPRVLASMIAGPILNVLCFCMGTSSTHTFLCVCARVNYNAFLLWVKLKHVCRAMFEPLQGSPPVCSRLHCWSCC